METRFDLLEHCTCIHFETCLIVPQTPTVYVPVVSPIRIVVKNALFPCQHLKRSARSCMGVEPRPVGIFSLVRPALRFHHTHLQITLTPANHARADYTPTPLLNNFFRAPLKTHTSNTHTHTHTHTPLQVTFMHTKITYAHLQITHTYTSTSHARSREASGLVLE